MFCPKCGSILIPKPVDDKKIMSCSSCNYTDSKGGRISETVTTKSEKIEVVDDTAENETMPTTDAECPKCQNKVAYYWTVQTRAADEAETKFLKCQKCNHTWRDYG